MVNWLKCCGCRRDRSVRWSRNVRRCNGPSGWITSAAACMRWTCSCCIRPSGAIMPLCAASPTSLSSSRHPTGSRTIAPRRSSSAAGRWRHRATWPAACTHCGRASSAQQQIGTKEDFPIYSSLLAETLALAGQPDKAVELLAEQRREFEQLSLRGVDAGTSAPPGGDRCCRPIPVPPRLLASILAAGGRSRDTQQAHMLGLRIAMTEARLDLRLGGAERRRVASPRHLRWSRRTMAASTCWRRARCNGACWSV